MTLPVTMTASVNVNSYIHNSVFIFYAPSTRPWARRWKNDQFHSFTGTAIDSLEGIDCPSTVDGASVDAPMGAPAGAMPLM